MAKVELNKLIGLFNQYVEDKDAKSFSSFVSSNSSSAVTASALNLSRLDANGDTNNKYAEFLKYVAKNFYDITTSYITRTGGRSSEAVRVAAIDDVLQPVYNRIQKFGLSLNIHEEDLLVKVDKLNQRSLLSICKPKLNKEDIKLKKVSKGHTVWSVLKWFIPTVVVGGVSAISGAIVSASVPVGTSVFVPGSPLLSFLLFGTIGGLVAAAATGIYVGIHKAIAPHYTRKYGRGKNNNCFLELLESELAAGKSVEDSIKSLPITKLQSIFTKTEEKIAQYRSKKHHWYNPIDWFRGIGNAARVSVNRNRYHELVAYQAELERKLNDTTSKYHSSSLMGGSVNSLYNQVKLFNISVVNSRLREIEIKGGRTLEYADIYCKHNVQSLEDRRSDGKKVSRRRVRKAYKQNRNKLFGILETAYGSCVKTLLCRDGNNLDCIDIKNYGINIEEAFEGEGVVDAKVKAGAEAKPDKDEEVAKPVKAEAKPVKEEVKKEAKKKEEKPAKKSWREKRAEKKVAKKKAAEEAAAVATEEPDEILPDYPLPAKPVKEKNRFLNKLTGLFRKGKKTSAPKPVSDDRKELDAEEEARLEAERIAEEKRKEAERARKEAEAERARREAEMAKIIAIKAAEEKARLEKEEKEKAKLKEEKEKTKKDADFDLGFGPASGDRVSASKPDKSKKDAEAEKAKREAEAEKAKKEAEEKRKELERLEAERKAKLEEEKKKAERVADFDLSFGPASGDRVSASKPAATKPTIAKPAKPTTAKPTKPAAAKPAAAKPATAKPAKPTTAKPAKPATTKPAKPADTKPTTEKPSTSKPAAEKPAATKPAEKPAAEKPADEKAEKPATSEKPASASGYTEFVLRVPTGTTVTVESKLDDGDTDSDGVK